MTFIELVVVITIFSIVTSVTLFNYRDFEAKVNIKNLAGDVAGKFTLAQRKALSGDLHPLADPDWRPAYGVHFDLTPATNTGNDVFYFFADLDQEGDFDSQLYSCSPYGTTECMEKISITKGNYIAGIKVFYEGNPIPDIINEPIDIVYTRPSGSAEISSPAIVLPLVTPISRVEVDLVSPGSKFNSVINVYSSGRIQIN